MNRIRDTILIVACLALVLVWHSAIALLILVAAGLFVAYRARPEPLLQMETYEASYEIVSRASGDARLTEEFRSVRSHRWNRVGKIDGFVESSSGYFSTPVYRNCQPASLQIRWNWLDNSEIKRRTRTVFEPPLGKTAVSYVLESRSYNLVAFNRRDRRDGGADSAEANTERIWHFIKSRIDTLTIRINFPDAIPLQTWVEARKGGSESAIDSDESGRIQRRARSAREYELTIDKPRVGYSYHIAWSLPDDEEQQLALTPAAAGLANELQQQLIRAADGSRQTELRAQLAVIRDKIEQLYPSGDLNVALYVYRSTNDTGALICASDLRTQPAHRGRIQVGRKVVGRCYRAKEVLLFNSLKPTSPDDQSYEAVPGEEALATPTVACGIPLLCPALEGRKVGVLYLTTRANLTKLTALLEKEDAVSTLLKEVTAWYAAGVPAALGMKDTLV